MREWTPRNARKIVMHIRCRQETRLRATRITGNLRVAEVEAARNVMQSQQDSV